MFEGLNFPKIDSLNKSNKSQGAFKSRIFAQKWTTFKKCFSYTLKYTNRAGFSVFLQLSSVSPLFKAKKSVKAEREKSNREGKTTEDKRRISTDLQRWGRDQEWGMRSRQRWAATFGKNLWETERQRQEMKTEYAKKKEEKKPIWKRNEKRERWWNGEFDRLCWWKVWSRTREGTRSHASGNRSHSRLVMELKNIVPKNKKVKNHQGLKLDLGLSRDSLKHSGRSPDLSN